MSHSPAAERRTCVLGPLKIVLAVVTVVSCFGRDAHAALSMEFRGQDGRTEFGAGEEFYVDVLLTSNQTEDFTSFDVALDLESDDGVIEGSFTGTVTDETTGGTDYIFPNNAGPTGATSNAGTEFDYTDNNSGTEASVLANTTYSVGRVFLTVAPTAQTGDTFKITVDTVTTDGDPATVFTGIGQSTNIPNTTTSFTVTAVPEPSSLFAMATFLGGGVVAQRVRRRRSRPNTSLATS